MTQLSTQDPTWPQQPEGDFELAGAEPQVRGAREWFFRVVPAFGALRTYTRRDLGRGAAEQEPRVSTLGLAPHEAVHVVRVAQDDPHDFFGHVRDAVVRQLGDVD